MGPRVLPAPAPRSFVGRFRPSRDRERSSQTREQGARGTPSARRQPSSPNAGGSRDQNRGFQVGHQDARPLENRALGHPDARSRERLVPQSPASAPTPCPRADSPRKGSPSRSRFRPPPPRTFRLRLAASAYCPQKRLRPNRAPCSVQERSYESARPSASGHEGFQNSGFARKSVIPACESEI